MVFWGLKQLPASVSVNLDIRVDRCVERCDTP